jgi:histone-lysine N-methyltransferase SETMAR
LAHKKIRFHHNAPAYSSGVVTAKLMELGFQAVPHPPYSPDLAPLDYFLFPNMKKWLAGRRFYSNEEMITIMNAYFAELCQSYSSEGINKLEQRWTKRIGLTKRTNLKGDNAQK